MIAIEVTTAEGYSVHTCMAGLEQLCGAFAAVEDRRALFAPAKHPGWRLGKLAERHGMPLIVRVCDPGTVVTLDDGRKFHAEIEGGWTRAH